MLITMRHHIDVVFCTHDTAHLHGGYASGELTAERLQVQRVEVLPGSDLEGTEGPQRPHAVCVRHGAQVADDGGGQRGDAEGGGWRLKLLEEEQDAEDVLVEHVVGDERSGAAAEHIKVERQWYAIGLCEC